MQAFLLLVAAMTKPLLMCLLGLAAIVGAIGAVSPRALTVTVAAGNRWIDTWHFFRVPEKSLLRRLDKWIEIDGFVLHHSRGMGVVMVVGAVVLGYCCVAWL